MPNPTSGTLAWVIPGTPPLSASEVEPTKANTLGTRSATSEALVEAFCLSSSASRASLRPQIPPAALTAEKSASTPWVPWLKLPVSGPVKPLTLPNVSCEAETPTSDAPLPAVPGQAAAAAWGEKSNPVDVGDTGDTAAGPMGPPEACPAPPDPVAPDPVTPPAVPPPLPTPLPPLHPAVVVTPPVPAAPPAWAEDPPEPDIDGS